MFHNNVVNTITVYCLLKISSVDVMCWCINKFGEDIIYLSWKKLETKYVYVIEMLQYCS